MEECYVCCNEFNSTKFKKISCPWCNFSTCRNCCETYILDQEATKCMNPERKPDGNLVCGLEWDRKFVSDNFTKSWVNGAWKNMLSKVTIDKEKALLPSMMGNIQSIKRTREIDLEIKELKKMKTEIDKKLNKLSDEKWRISLSPEHSSEQKNHTGEGFTRRCPDPDCKGYLNNNWKCGLCTKWACSKCNTIKGASKDSHHECNQDDVKTEELLKNDTKSCPSCQTPIFKINGCNQMWCTKCHTAFNWRTGLIETTAIHNPHYFQWLHSRNRQETLNEEVNPCQNPLENRASYISLRKLVKDAGSSRLTEVVLDNIVQSATHLRVVQRRKYNDEDITDPNKEIRIKYLLNEFDDKQFESKIFAANKKRQKNRDILNVIDLQLQGISDSLARLTSSKSISSLALDNMLDELEQLTNYSNDLLFDVAKTYGGKRLTMLLSRNIENHNGNVLV